MKEKTLHILLLFCTVLTYGQVTLAISEVKDAKVNQRLNLTVLLEIAGENMQQETPLRMPDLSKFEILGSASEQNTVVLDAKKGDILNQMVYQLALSPKQPGKLRFGSVLVTVNGKIYKTEPFEINVRDSEKKSSVADNAAANDVYLTVDIQDKDVYKNEPAVAVVRAHSRNYDNFRKLSKIHFPHQKNVRIKPVSFAKSEIETSAGTASQVLGVFMIFPTESGKVELNPVTTTITSPTKEHKISSNRVALNVKKLPSGMPENYKNAVGNFDISVAKKNATETPELEKPVNISLKLSGTGNFGTLHLPKIVSSENYTSFPPKITSKTSPQNDQLSGDIIVDYVVIPKKTGPISVDFENFSFFDPSAKKYVDLGAKSILLNVKTHEQIVESKSTLEKVNDYTNTVLETVNTPVLQTHNLKIKDKNKINWKIVAGNLAFMAALFSLFLVVKKKIKTSKEKPVVERKPIVTIAETEALLREKMSHQFEDHIEYLKKLAKEKDFIKFFSTYEEMKTDVKTSLEISTESEFRKYLEENNGHPLADQYRALSEEIQIEKYAPYHSEEQIEELLKRIISIYTEIRK
ncbi:BatD family protein [Kaistella montana]|uniref:BatD family protein n=1 Tax=Kaistella montana TaxID=1849733 RepID=A0ABW5K662_9FLAO|nr:BatD family protein [Kaistella montana]MCQ4034209.1 BatD family protein [Kaistella montana]